MAKPIDLTAIAAAIRQHSPGALPESLHFSPNGHAYNTSKCGSHTGWLSDDIAEVVLCHAMTKDACLWYAGDGWTVLDKVFCGQTVSFLDANHGGSLGACFKAWSFAKGIA